MVHKTCIIINIKKQKLSLNYHEYKIVFSYGTFSYGLKNEFEIAMVNEPSVFEPLKVYCSFVLRLQVLRQSFYSST